MEELAPQCGSPFALRYIHEKRKGSSHARNRGIEEARGEIIAFLDDDVYVSPNWLTAILECFRRTGASAVGGRTITHWEGEPELAVRLKQAHGESLDMGDRDLHLRGRSVPGSGNAACRRGVFDDGLRFSTDLGRVGSGLLSGEDTELFQRLQMQGKTIWYCAKAVVRHRASGERLTAAYLVKLHYWYGISYAIIDRKLRGKLFQVTRACARAAKALLVEAPRWALALVLRDQCKKLTAKCSLAKQCGYLRAALSPGGLVSQPSPAGKNGESPAGESNGRRDAPRFEPVNPAEGKK